MILRRSADVGLFLVLLSMSFLFSGCNPPIQKPPKSVAEEPVIRVRIYGPSTSIPVSISGAFTIQNNARQVVYQGANLANTNVTVQAGFLRIGSQQIPF